MRSARILGWDLRKLAVTDTPAKEHKLTQVVEYNIQTDHLIPARRPDLIIN